jgi:hypothetical protein
MVETLDHSRHRRAVVNCLLSFCFKNSGDLSSLFFFKINRIVYFSIMKRSYKSAVVVLMIGVAIAYSGFVYEDWNPNEHAHHDHSDLYHEHSHRESFIQLPERLLFPSPEPDRVILNLTESPETSLAVNWRTDTSLDTGYVELPSPLQGRNSKN